MWWQGSCCCRQCRAMPKQARLHVDTKRRQVDDELCANANPNITAAGCTLSGPLARRIACTSELLTHPGEGCIPVQLKPVRRGAAPEVSSAQVFRRHHILQQPV